MSCSKSAIIAGSFCQPFSPNELRQITKFTSTVFIGVLALADQ